MNKDKRNPFHSGLYIEERLPLHWNRVETRGKDGSVSQEQGQNHRLLRLLNLLDEGEMERTQEAAIRAREMERLELKMDMVIELLVDLLGQRREPSEVTQVRCSVARIEWLCHVGQPPEPGDQLKLALLLDARLPSPLRFRAQVVDMAAEGERSHWIRAELMPQGEQVEELLGRLIFRRHRRQIAMSRSTQQE